MNNAPYALFFDIDGTLVSFKTHTIPPSTVDALTRAKQRGASIFISTGRPRCIIDNLTPIEHLIDGFITINGGYCFVGDRVVYCHPIPADDLEHALDQIGRRRLACIVVGQTDTAVMNRQPIVDRIFVHDLNVTRINFTRPVDNLLASEPIMQLSLFAPIEVEREIMPLMPGSISGRWHPEFTDITAARANKGEGLLAMAEALGFDMARTIAFGDGGNDLSIIRAAGIGVAMGNANDELLAAADYVTTAVDDHGIARALAHLGVIDRP